MHVAPASLLLLTAAVSSCCRAQDVIERLGVAERLWRGAQSSARRSALHGFVVGLADGGTSVPPRSYERYLAQDAFFLLAFSQAYAAAKMKLRDGDARGSTRLDMLMSSVLEELELHRGSVEVDDKLSPLPATAAYVDFLQSVAGDPATTVEEVLAAMAPCMRLYCELGSVLSKALPESTTDANAYRDWVIQYSSSEFAAAAEEVDSLLNEYAAAPGAAPFEKLAELYNQAMLLEYGFFDAQIVDGPVSTASVARVRKRLDLDWGTRQSDVVPDTRISGENKADHGNEEHADEL